jgi:hypothetical protein
VSEPTARSLVRNLLRIDRPIRPERDLDFPCPSEDFSPGKPNGDCDTDGHYMCRECVNANPETIAERDEQC